MCIPYIVAGVVNASVWRSNVYILTQGGPAGSTDLLSTVAYRNAFSSLQGGYASATDVVMALISGAVVTVCLIIRKARKWET